MRTLNNILLLSLVFCLAACSTSFPFPGLYKPVVQQGNIMTEDMVAELHYGMTQDQVVEVMGSPVISNPFSTEVWNYVYTVKPGKQPLQVQRLTLTFSPYGQLVGITKEGF